MERKFPGSEQLKIGLWDVLSMDREARSADVGIFPGRGEGKLQKSMRRMGKSENSFWGRKYFENLFSILWKNTFRIDLKILILGVDFQESVSRLNFSRRNGRIPLVNIHFHEISE